MTEPPDPVALTVHDDLPPHEASVVSAGLGASNLATAPLQDVRSLSCFARAPDDAVVGGAIGRTWGACCELQQLWVESSWRGKGLGHRLMKTFEAAARLRGCTTYYLETFSFQSPNFYLARGYRELARIDGFAPGVVKYLMVRHEQAQDGVAEQGGSGRGR